MLDSFEAVYSEMADFSQSAIDHTHDYFSFEHAIARATGGFSYNEDKFHDGMLSISPVLGMPYESPSASTSVRSTTSSESNASDSSSSSDDDENVLITNPEMYDLPYIPQDPAFWRVQHHQGSVNLGPRKRSPLSMSTRRQPAAISLPAADILPSRPFPPPIYPSPISKGPDSETEYESDENDSDDEYIPSMDGKESKRKAGTYLLSMGRAKRARLAPAPASRNAQATTATVAAIRQAVSNKSNETTNFICPQCGWEQKNRRMPDFKRHLRTHTRPSDQEEHVGWRCKGILVDDAHKTHVPFGAKTYVFLGKQRTGGCMRTFSRRDALKRHLDNINVTCIGTPSDPGVN